MKSINENENNQVPDLKLKDMENVYQKMIMEVEDYAIILLDNEGIIQNWNKGAENIKQYKEAEAVGKNFRMFYLPEDRANQVPEKMLEEAKLHGRALHEGWRLRKDGTRFWGSITLTALHNEEGEIIGYSKMTRDLTERKTAEDNLKAYSNSLEKTNEALRKSEERYHRMIAEVQDYAIILLNKKGDIQNWNAGAQKIKGYRAEEIIGKNFRIFYLPEDQQSGLPQKLIQEAASLGKATHEGWRVRKDGTRFWGSIVITALHNDQGDIIGYSKVTRDLTERKLSEDRAQKYLEELQNQNKELERFAYVASHDLQEPLRKIRTFIDIIQRNVNNPDMVNKFFTKINSSAQRMSELIGAVLNYSRLGQEVGHTEDVNLNEVLNHVIEDFELSIEEKHAVIKKDALPSVKGNRLQISQVFSNLIGNALKFSTGKPEIRIQTGIVDRTIIASDSPNLSDGKYFEIVFSDNGIGFEPQYEKKIFSLFERLHGMHEFSGTGIGLAVCKRIMENHKGYIAATSEPGKGAKFYVYFPVNSR